MNATIQELIVMSFIPLIASILLYFVFKGKKINYWLKQIIVGIVFGAIAILGTECGVRLDGAIMNARDAAPLCAAIIFGAPAGIIAGIIGGVERWFAISWGAETFTRLACSIATIFAGVFGAILKKYMFDNKIPNYAYAFIIGAVTETFHMMLIFITNNNSIQAAYNLIEQIAAPMILANAISLSAAVLVVNLIDPEERFEKKGRITLSQQFLRNVFAVVIIALMATSYFIFATQKKITIDRTENILRTNIQDLKDDINTKSNNNLLKICHKIEQELEGKEYSEELLDSLCEKYEVAEINIINNDGIITYSTYEDFIGYDMSQGTQSSEFLCLLSGTEEYAQSYQVISYNSKLYRKYAGVPLIDGGFVQVGYYAEDFQNDLAEQIKNIASFRHIEEGGGLVIIDGWDKIVSDNNGRAGESIDNLDELKENEDTPENTLLINKFEGEDVYYMYAETEGYTIIAYIPKDSANLSMNVSVCINIFMLVIVFAILFTLIYFSTKILVVDNIQDIDNSLQNISEGNLDVVVDIRANQEFDSLSTNINTTVDSMKNLINEASKRIDDELQYAKDIQESALPSNFPAFPNNNEFDIYATMNPAKQVGGDFYDLYMIDDNHLVFVVADVAGKGIPAALFMMRAKSILKSYMQAGVSVADTFTNANYTLTEGNSADMFVTAWMGMLDIKTGELQYANAGHNKPLIKRKDGNYEYLQGPPGFVLGGLEGMIYKQQTATLYPGDALFLYTDGVVEATNNDKQLYGDARLHEAINKHKEEGCKELINSIRIDVAEFVKDAAQSDDITMLSFEFFKNAD